jgi:hypothetical protein
LRFTQFYKQRAAARRARRCRPDSIRTRAGASATWSIPKRPGAYRGTLNRNCVTIAEALNPAGWPARAMTGAL